ncbi:Protein of unknown function [Verrucomicrobium sp. GAS474]|uniref:glycosyltransferase family 61 protein n=1 Tax=Verrucomicrobium sp. GAS474 TaxID=1882831 RepID=UPI00087D83F9|nr:glycosyltransferase family 61 protein [Verrucomicrobium sp. GAS474]SDU23830.1 Protein of unknown function [Verrucomicrobium sp. GAS474]
MLGASTVSPPSPKPDWLPWSHVPWRSRLLRFLVFEVWSGLVRRLHRAPDVYRAQRITAPWPGNRPPEATGSLLDAFRFYNRHWTTVDHAQDEYVYDVTASGRGSRPLRIDPVGGWVILPGYGVIRESVPNGYCLGVPGLRSYLRQAPDPVLPEIVLLTDPFDTNHGHFLNDILGRLALFERRGVSRAIPVVISARLANHPLWRECLANGSPALRDRKWIVMDSETPIDAGRVIFGKSAVNDRETGEGVLRLIGCCPPPPAGPGQAIFLTRRNRRSFSNLAEIEAAAEAAGLRVVDPGTLSFKAQMELFADASVIVGPHGSAFDNTLFRQGAPLRLLEIFPPGFAPPYHCWQAAAFGYTYRSLHVNGARKEKEEAGAAEASDFYLSADDFAAALRAFLSETK